MSEQPEQDRSVRVSPDVYRDLLTIQYSRKMIGETLSFSEIIRRALKQLLAAQPVKP